MVFYISIIIVAIYVIGGFFSPDGLAQIADYFYGLIIEKFGWFYLVATIGFLIFSLYLAFSKYGDIRLGKEEERPEYSYITWFAMLFSAGMGIGLVFWGVAEPISHYMNPPMGLSPGTPEAAKAAMRYAFFHWGLHPWALYTIVGLALAYFTFRKGYPTLVSSIFYPLLGEKVNGGVGKAIDILAILVTVFGVATSLGMGALQINGGIAHLFNLPSNIMMQIIIIAVVTFLFILSATTGIDKGIKFLSDLNIGVAMALLLFVLFLGPTIFIIDLFVDTLGGYARNIIEMSLSLDPFTENTWIADWTLFYWAWWISWAPFVGVFIARISKGRTIREFVSGVLLVPSIFGFIWFTVFGGTALNFEIFKGCNIAEAVQNDVTSALFTTLSFLPLGKSISLIAILLIITFFITSADSATFVLAMLSSNGNLNPKNKIKLLWGILQSAIAIVLLLSGGINAIQTIAIIMGLPFAFIMVGMCFSILKSLKAEKIEKTGICDEITQPEKE